MSHSFSIAENRHHLLLAEAHQVNEFLDARLVAAEVSDGQRLAVAENVLTLALQAREYGKSENEDTPHIDVRAPGLAEMVRLLPLTDAGRDKLIIDINAADPCLSEYISDGSAPADPVDRALVLYVLLTGRGWPRHFAVAVALADSGRDAVRALWPLRDHPAEGGTDGADHLRQIRHDILKTSSVPNHWGQGSP